MGTTLSPELIAQTKEVVDALDSGRALRLLRGIQERGVDLDKNTELALMLTAFPDLPDTQAVSVMENSVLRFYILGIPLRNRLEARYVFSGPTEKNKQRTLLKEAILRNKEQLGPLTIGGWLQEYEMQYPENSRNEGAVMDFSLKNKRVSSLSKTQTAVLKDILGIYDDWIAFDLFDIFNLTAIERSLNQTDGFLQESRNKREESPYQASPFVDPTQAKTNQIQPSFVQDPSQKREAVAELTSEIVIELLTLQKALQKYPRVMNQGITSGEIMLRGAREAVPGTLKNWITSYQQDIGPAPHEPFERNQFLFHNRNALVLSPGERNILSEILRSFDEGLPLPIDSVQQQIVLDRMQGDADLSEQVLENQGGKIKEGTLSLVEFEDPSKKSERPSFSKEGSSQYESIQKEVQNAESLQNASSKKEVSHAKQMASDAEMGHKEDPGKIQGQRMRGDVGVQRPQKTLGDASKKADSFINKLTKGQKQIEGLQHELQGGSVRHDDRGKGEQKHVQPRTKGNKQQSLQTQLKGREALFYDGLQSVSLPGRPKQSIRQPKVGKAQMKTDMETASDSQTAEVQEDYTDYYPIPQKNTKEWMVKRPPRSGAAQPKNDHLGARSGVTNMQFTQHQTFSGEKKQRNISNNSRWSQPRTPRLSHQDRTGAPAPPHTAKKPKEDMPSDGGSNLIIE